MCHILPEQRVGKYDKIFYRCLNKVHRYLFSDEPLSHLKFKSYINHLILGFLIFEKRLGSFILKKTFWRKNSPEKKNRYFFFLFVVATWFNHYSCQTDRSSKIKSFSNHFLVSLMIIPIDFIYGFKLHLICFFSFSVLFFFAYYHERISEINSAIHTWLNTIYLAHNVFGFPNNPLTIRKIKRIKRSKIKWNPAIFQTLCTHDWIKDIHYRIREMNGAELAKWYSAFVQ